MKETYRRIGLLLGIIYILTYLLDLTGVLIGDDSVVYTLADKVVLLYALILLGLVLIPYKNFPLQFTKRVVMIPIKRICMFYQFFGLIVTASLLIMYRKETPFLLTIILITGLMGVKYHIMHYRGVLVLALYYFIILAVESTVTGLNIHVFKMFVDSLLFFLVLLTLFQDELRAQFDLMKKYREQTVNMRKRLKNYESSQLDPASFGLTQREMEVLEILCITNSSNQELANELGIKIHTVKTHLRNIFDKAGVDDRHQLIDLCRSYFITRQNADQKQAVRMPR